MIPDLDPYRTLGLAQGATLDEVRRAYRRLAKEHHPDSGGEATLPRFLAIQGAYEQLVGGSPLRRRPGAPQRPTPRRPWQADPDRGEATKRAYGAPGRPGTGDATGSDAGAPGRGDGAGPDRPRPGPAGGAPRSGRAGTGRDAPRGQTGAPGQADRSGAADAGRTTGRGKRDGDQPKATLGSTSYDGVHDMPFEPDWAGADWYGAPSGTYWTLNPKEYADPRKHGPEYQARARRRADQLAGDRAAEEPPDIESMDPTIDPPAVATGPGATRSGPSTQGPPIVDRREGGARPPPARPRADALPRADPGRAFSRTEPIPDPTAAAANLSRALVDEPPDGPGSRLVLALGGGLPIGLALLWLAGEVTGCGRFAATCSGGHEIGLWAALGLTVAGLFLVPRIAAIAAVGTVGLVVAALPAGVFLSAIGGARVRGASGTALGLILVVAWIAGVVYAVVRTRRRDRALRPDRSARP